MAKTNVQSLTRFGVTVFGGVVLWAAVTPAAASAPQSTDEVQVPARSMAPVSSHARADWSALLPPGPGREYTVDLCSHCHTVGVLVLQRRTRTMWRDHLLGARSARETFAELCFCLGGLLTDEEVEIVASYLGEVSGLDNPIEQLPLNVNTASPDALRRLPGITDADVRKLVERRAREPFSNKEQLKRVLGADKFRQAGGFLDVKDSMFRFEGLIPM